MYDVHALNLINEAPLFGDINLDSLPKEFTDVYTEIVTVRVQLNENDNINIEELKLKLKRLLKVSNTYELYVFLKKESENIKAAAFIGATAYSLVYQINEILSSREVSSRNIITENSIHPLLSSSMLYFISGYTADAIEIISNITISNENSVTNNLFISLYQLLTGNIDNEINLNLTYEGNSTDSLIENASDLLWIKLNEAVNRILAACTYLSRDTDSEFLEANRIVDLVIGLTVSDNELNFERFSVNSQSIYIGQNYLANYLKILIGVIPEIALINVNHPEGIDELIWKEKLARFTYKRPYLWPNHINAINTNYLNKGISSVISFPTGGGKSTLSELKILTSIILDEPVIFIVPTLALVDQVSNSLKSIFPEASMKDNYEEFSSDDSSLPNISVMTPESCLVKLNFNPELFSNLGLFVFDECHLLNPKSTDNMDRRSIDAMICLLKIIESAPNTDLLMLSAMLSNSEEISAWLQSIIGKDVVPLTLNWKPTQQVKGCVVYKNDDIVQLKRFIRTAPKTTSNKLTTQAKRELNITPYGFFSLNQTWHSTRIRDYKLSRLTSSNVLLTTNNFNQLTSNRNVVAAKIAMNSTNSKIKTLVFGLTRNDCESIVKEISRNQTRTIDFLEKEQVLFDLLIEEFGNSSCLYVSNESGSLPHHGLLTKNERLLHEMLFKRDSGVDSLVATSTLAQGINLPAELVIIAGDLRFDAELENQELLEAHELLNAAGRAGRAGKNSKGMVLIVPGKVVEYNQSERRITNHWHSLKEIFTNSDQCLDLADPFEYMLDKIHLSQTVDEDTIYFLNTLSTDNIDRLVNKSFIAYKKSDNTDWLQERVESIHTLVSKISSEEEASQNAWIKGISSSYSIPTSVLHRLYNDFITSLDSFTSPNNLIRWYIEWLTTNRSSIDYFIRMSVFEENFGNPFKSYTLEEKTNFFNSILLDLVNQWISGSPLMDIEANIPSLRENTKCEKSRKFSLKIIPELTYSIGILCQLYKNHRLELSNEDFENNLNIELLSLLVKNGMDSPEKLALHYILKDETSRVHTHNIFYKLADSIMNIEHNNSFSDLKSAIYRVYQQNQD